MLGLMVPHLFYLSIHDVKIKTQNTLKLLKKTLDMYDLGLDRYDLGLDRYN